MRGTVVAVGDGRWLESGKFIGTSLEEGAVVLYGKYAGTEVEFDGVPHLLIREEEVLALELPDAPPSA